MVGRPAQALSLEEQLECAKILREEQLASRGTSRGTGARRGRGRPRALASAHGMGSNRSARHPTVATSPPTVSSTLGSSRQGTGKPLPGNKGFLPGVAAAASPASDHSTKLPAPVGDFQPPKATISNNILPHMRHTLQIDDTSSSGASRQLPLTNVLQNITNRPELLEPDSGNSKTPLKLIQGTTSTSNVKKEPVLPFRVEHPSSKCHGGLATSRHKEANFPGFTTNDSVVYGNELARTVNSRAANVAGTMPFTALQPASQIPESESTSQLRHHARNVSNTSDVDMTGVDTHIDGESRPKLRKHGGLAESLWALSFNQAPAESQQLASDPFEKRWIPTRISHPTPTPAHLLPQRPSKTIETTDISTRVSTFVPRTDQDSQQLHPITSTDAGRGNRKGGLASSQWAS